MCTDACVADPNIIRSIILVLVLNPRFSSPLIPMLMFEPYPLLDILLFELVCF